MLVEADDDAHPSLEVLPVWWQDRAACLGVDPEVFFPPPSYDQTAKARAVCVTCPVLAQCRDYADALEEGLGRSHLFGSSKDLPNGGGAGEVRASARPETCDASGVYFAYADETGNVGASGTRTYGVGCIFVRDLDWPAIFDQLIDWRRFLRRQFGLPVRAEMKANYLLHNRGPFAALRLGERVRRDIYRMAVRVQPKLGLLSFAVVIDKRRLAISKPSRDPREVAWEFVLQRFERFNSPVGSHPGQPILFVHDEGEAPLVRKLARRARRAGTAGSAFGTGMLNRPAKLLLDDPVPRDSRHSYFLQLADLNAYAAFRRIHPPPQRPVQIVPQSLWDQLGTAIYHQANQLAGGPPGVVAWP